MGSFDHLDPGRGGQLPLREHPSHVIVEISAAVPGMVSNPASLSPTSQSRIGTPAFADAVTISIGEKACTCMSGTAALIALIISA
jgi:hypothetical protein